MQTKKISLMLLMIAICSACAPYRSPERSTWPRHLAGASMEDMSEIARIAKRPVYQGTGGRLVTETVKMPAGMEYGDKTTHDNTISLQYMIALENELYNTLRRPGISVQRAGTDVVIILVRDAIMELNVGEVSQTGAETLGDISKILNQFDATFIEVAGYTDAMTNTQASKALSQDMAQRVGVFFSQKGINTSRLFIVGRGAARPIAAQDNVGRLTNRRLEIRIAPAR